MGKIKYLPHAMTMGSGQSHLLKDNPFGITVFQATDAAASDSHRRPTCPF